MALGIGDVIDGKYKIVRLLGEGGMGAVFEGENTRIHRRVAIKVLHGEVAQNSEAMTRFEREAQAAGRIGSEHIVEVLDMGDLPGGERYMVMEFLEGEALSDRIAQGSMAPRAIAAMMAEMLEGLSAAHSAGIVHRDLKPDNIFLLSNRSGKKDFVKIVDFGISKFNTLGGEFSMTRTGAVMGTPYYMAPEQAKGRGGVDHRADIYAVGVILYQAVVGHVPFQAETFNELLFKIVLETPPPLSEKVPGIDEGFVNIVSKAMAREPDHRYQTAADFQAALRSWLGGAHIPADLTVNVGTPFGLDKTGLDKTATPAAGMPLPTFAGIGDTAQLGNQTTPGAWGAESASPELPVKKGIPKVVFAGAALVLLGGIGIFVSSGGGDEASVPSAAEADAERTKEMEEARKAELDTLRVEQEKARQAQESADAARALAEKSKQDAESEAKSSGKPAPSTAPPAPSPTKKSPATATASAAAPAAAPAPAAPKPSPDPAAARTGGRLITTDL